MFSKAKELDEYCNQIEAQVTLYHTQATSLQEENEQLQKKVFSHIIFSYSYVELTFLVLFLLFAD